MEKYMRPPNIFMESALLWFRNAILIVIQTQEGQTMKCRGLYRMKRYASYLTAQRIRLVEQCDIV
jgi:hypothetical protein